MRWLFGIVCIILVAQITIAAETQPQALPSQSVVDAQIASANRYLAAEVSRQMLEQKEAILTEMKNYQDDNFRIFDGRMATLMSDMKMKVTLGAMGAILLVNAVVAFIILRQMRNYSYEKYQETLIGKQQERIQEMEASIGVKNMQQPAWNVQQPMQTIGMELGQAQTSQVSQMNQWQAQPAYAGAWQSPVQVQKDYGYNQQVAQKESYNVPLDSYQMRASQGGEEEWSPNDPMSSSAWRGGTGG